ncbi:MAG: hypothetical protein J6Z50_03615, partial [Fibrobacterales bacterium]|nr:hypothetical protein [Fibrobacterales bacterium]MBP5188200.1 hypothetical protein [Fibrobacterales bacterium]
PVGVFVPPPAAECDLARALLDPAALDLVGKIADSFDPTILSDARLAEIVDALLAEVSAGGEIDLRSLSDLLSEESRDVLAYLLPSDAAPAAGERRENAADLALATYLQTVFYLQLRRIGAGLSAISGDPAKLDLWQQGNALQKKLESLRRAAGAPGANLVGILEQYNDELERLAREFVALSRK